MEKKLVLIRHGQSLWNKENRFTGFTDIDLSEKGVNEALESASIIVKNNIDIDIAFTSNLKRAINTCKLITENIPKLTEKYHNEKVSEGINIECDSALNERDYGDLTGKNKKEIAEEYGIDCVHKWRRGFYNRPQNGENLDDVCKRVSKYYNEKIKSNLENKNVLVAAHGNSLRALFVVLGLYSENEIERIEIPTGTPYVITFKNGEIVNSGYLCPIKMKGRQILDSRGNPTLEVDVLNNDKVISRESCPSGASTGTNEARELRDNSVSYLGKSVECAVKNVDKFSSSRYIDIPDITDQITFDSKLCSFDGTELKENIGGNTTTAISFSVASASSNLLNIELFEHFRNTYKLVEKYKMPTPMVNILNGGKHAGGNLQIQEFMIMPRSDILFRDMLHNVSVVYHNLKKILIKKYSISAKNLGDEGGYAPQLDTPEEALNVIEEAVEMSGLTCGEDIFLALDCASSEYYNKETKKYEVEKNLFLNSSELKEYYKNLINKHPSLKSIEDPFDEYDYEGWSEFTKEMSDKIMIVGDDLFTTNISTVRKGLDNKWANSLLLKVNQIGTITEAVNSAKLMFAENKDVIVSHRSGETTSTLISDLAVGIGAGYIKIGAPARGERVAKYNRLLQIEEYLMS